MAIAAFSQTSVATAMPLIVADLGFLRDYSWVIVASIVPAAISAPAFGAAADRWGRRRVLLVGILAFCLGALGAGLAQSMQQLIGARVLHGIGIGGMMTLAQTLVADLVPVARRGAYVAVLGTVFGAATVAGPLLGGWIADELGWRWVFLGTIPPGLLAVPMVIAWLRAPGADAAARIDVPGLVAISVSASAAMVALLWGGVRYDWGSPQILGLALLALIAAAIAWRIETRSASPIVDVGGLREPIVGLTSLAALLGGAVLFGIVLFVPLYLQGVRGVGVTESGLVLVWFIAAFAAAAAAATRIGSTRGAWRTVLVVGGAVTVLGAGLASTISPGGGRLDTIGPLLALGMGLGLVLPAIVQLVQLAAPAGRLGRLTALHQFCRAFGGAVGVAVAGAIVNNRLADAVLDALPAHLHDRMGDLSYRNATSLGIPDDANLVEAYLMLAAIRGGLDAVLTEALQVLTLVAVVLLVVLVLLAHRIGPPVPAAQALQSEGATPE